MKTLTVIASVFLTSVGAADPQVIGRWPTDELIQPHWVVVAGHHAWAADNDGKRLQAVDLNDPAVLPVVGEVQMPGRILGMVATDSHVWVMADGTGLVILDISDLSQPRQAGAYQTEGRPRGVAVDDTRAYLLEIRQGADESSHSTSVVNVLDVTDPASPQLLSEYELPPLDSGPTEAKGLAVADGLMCVQRGGWFDESLGTIISRLDIVDVTDPAHPRWVGSYETEGDPGPLVLSGRRALWAHPDIYASPLRSTFEVVDLEEPANPVRMGSLAVSQLASQIAVSGNLAFVGKGGNGLANGGLDLIDLSDPAALRRVGTWSIPSQSWTSWAGYPTATGVAVTGAKVCVATGLAGLQLLDIANPETPTLLGTVPAAPATRGVTLANGRAYFAGGQEGLIILDLSDPAQPRRLGAVRVVGQSARVAVQGNYAYVATEVSGLHVIDIADPASPRRVGGINLNTGFADVAAVGSYLYLASPGSGLEILDISNPAVPRRQTTQLLAFEGRGVAMAVSDQYAYLAQIGYSGGGLVGLVEVFDLIDPAAPQWVGACNTPGPARDIVVRDQKAYVVGTWYDAALQQDRGYLEILDVANPANPALVSRYSCVNARNIAVDAQVAWLAGTDRTVEIVDVANPSLPRRLGILAVDAFNDVAVLGNLGFLVGGNGEVTIAEPVSVPAPPELDIVRASNVLTLSWPTTATGFGLESTDALAPASNWQPERTAPVLNGEQNVVTLDTSSGTKFFRLKKP